MATILCLETSTSVCSVALVRDGKLLSCHEENKGFSHAEKLTIFIEQVVSEAGISLAELDAVAVSSGPGSYTGLRIGVSTAKGLCYALDKPLIGIPSLEAIAAGAIQKLQLNSGTYARHAASECIVIPVIDARRMEVYCAIYDRELNEIEAVAAKIVEKDDFRDYHEKQAVFIVGDGVGKLAPALGKLPCFQLYTDLLPSAMNMMGLAELRYFKEFVPGRRPGGL
jgi:tRNA threonylcarbamoyladenosine biosynthesis protein TsaB